MNLQFRSKHYWLLVLAGLIGGLPAKAQPVINNSPASQNNVALGSAVTLSADVTAGASARYQWRRNGLNIAGATAPSYSIASFQATDGGSYTLVASDDTGVATTSPARLNPQVTLLSAVDNILSLLDLNLVANGVGRANNLLASREANEPRHAGKRGNKSVWFKWQPALGLLKGIATVSTVGSDFDTLLAVYTRSLTGVLTEITSNDDRGGFLNSSVTFEAQLLQEYWIAVAGLGEDAGDIVLKWDFEVSNDLLPKILTKPTSRSARRGAQVDLTLNATGGNIQWFHNGQGVPGSPNLTLANLDLAQLGTYFARISNPNRITLSEPVMVQIHERADGVTVSDVLAYDKYAEANDTLGGGGAARASLEPARRRRVSLARGYSGTQTFNTYGSGNEEGEPNHCGVVGGASQWFAYQAESDGILVIDTQGSDFDTVLAVYTGDGTSYSSLQSVACNNDHAGNPWSRVSFSATSGTVYYIAVDGVNGATGTAYINYNLDPSPTISSPAGQTTNEDTPVTVAFTVNDIGTALNNLTLSGTSSDLLLVPASNFVFGGTDGNRTITITPAANRSGTVTMSITVSDGGQTATMAFNLTVNAVNDAPVARADTVQRPQGEPLKLSITKLMANDSDADGDPLTLSAVVSPTSNGASVLADARWIYYTPPGGYNDTDVVTYTVMDSSGAQASTTITISIAPASTSQPPNHIGIARMNGGSMRINFVGIPGRSYTIQASTDLAVWSVIGTSPAGSNGAYEFTDVDAPNYSSRYYRSVWP